MRKVVGLLVCLSVLLSSSVSFAYTAEVKAYIPEKHLLFVVYGADPDKSLDEEAIRKFIYSMNLPNVDDLRIVIYDKGKSFGEGIRAFFARYYGFKEWRLLRTQEKPLIEESVLGYPIRFKNLFAEYVKDPLAVKALYTNKILALYMKITRIASDNKGTPYVEAELHEKERTLIARVYLNKNDPLLAKHQVGHTIGVYAQVTDFSDTMVTLKGQIIDW